MKNILRSLLSLLALVLGLTATAQAQTVDWIRQSDTRGDDRSTSVSADGLGNVCITGDTLGNLEGINAGRGDVFLVKILPEPSSLLLLSLSCLGLLLGRRRERA